MKNLTTSQQTELRELLESLQGFGIDVQDQINYWAIELKPKRLRRLPSEGSIPSNNLMDN